MRNRCALLVLVLCFFCQDTPVYAQDRLSLSQLTKEVVTDKTTYVFAGLFWTATQGDWVSSQNWFRNGYVERNPDFTISGKPCDLPVSFGAGNRKIVLFTAQIIGTTMLTNTGIRVGEHFLNKQYPGHKRLVAALGWIGRIGYGVILTKNNTVPHIVQWQKNTRAAGP